MRYTANEFARYFSGISARGGPLVSGATHSGQAIDTRGYNEAAFVASAGTARTDATAIVKLQESPSTTAASFADISGATMPTITATTIHGLRVNLDGKKRYLRLFVTYPAAASTVALSVGVTLFPERTLPVTQRAAFKTV